MRRSLPPLAVEQDGEQIVGQHLLHDLGDVGQQLVQVERLRGGGRHFQQEVEQLGPLLETDGGFAR